MSDEKSMDGDWILGGYSLKKEPVMRFWINEYAETGSLQLFTSKEDALRSPHLGGERITYGFADPVKTIRE